MAEEPARTTVTRNISLDSETDAMVVAKLDELATMTGDRNYSAAVRFIVREWANYSKLTRRPTPSNAQA